MPRIKQTCFKIFPSFPQRQYAEGNAATAERIVGPPRLIIADEPGAGSGVRTAGPSPDIERSSYDLLDLLNLGFEQPPKLISERARELDPVDHALEQRLSWCSGGGATQATLNCAEKTLSCKTVLL